MLSCREDTCQSAPYAFEVGVRVVRTAFLECLGEFAVDDSRRVGDVSCVGELTEGPDDAGAATVEAASGSVTIADRVCRLERPAPRRRVDLPLCPLCDPGNGLSGGRLAEELPAEGLVAIWREEHAAKRRRRAPRSCRHAPPRASRAALHGSHVPAPQ